MLSNYIISLTKNKYLTSKYLVMKKLDYYEICKQKLKYLNYSDRTIKSYLHYINQFLSNVNTNPI